MNEDQFGMAAVHERLYRLVERDDCRLRIEKDLVNSHYRWCVELQWFPDHTSEWVTIIELGDHREFVIAAACDRFEKACERLEETKDSPPVDEGSRGGVS